MLGLTEEPRITQYPVGPRKDRYQPPRHAAWSEVTLACWGFRWFRAVEHRACIVEQTHRGYVTFIGPVTRGNYRIVYRVLQPLLEERRQAKMRSLTQKL